MDNPTSLLPNNYCQIILNNVPLKNGDSKTLIYTKDLCDKFISYQEVFEYLEDYSGIPKKYFILRYNGNDINYIDAFVKYYNSYTHDNNTYFTANEQHMFVNVRLHMNIDYAIYKFYKYAIDANNCDVMYLQILEFADGLYNSQKYCINSFIDNDPCYLSYMLVIKYTNKFSHLSRYKQYRVVTNIENIKQKYQLNNLAKL